MESRGFLSPFLPLRSMATGSLSGFGKPPICSSRCGMWLARTGGHRWQLGTSRCGPRPSLQTISGSLQWRRVWSPKTVLQDSGWETASMPKCPSAKRSSCKSRFQLRGHPPKQRWLSSLQLPDASQERLCGTLGLIESLAGLGGLDLTGVLALVPPPILA